MEEAFSGFVRVSAFGMDTRSAQIQGEAVRSRVATGVADSCCDGWEEVAAASSVTASENSKYCGLWTINLNFF